jgi:O-antigen ligase
MMVNTLLALALFGDRLKGGRLDRNSISIGLAAFYLFTAVVSIWVLYETGTKGSMLGLFVGVIVGTGSYAFFSGHKRVRIYAIVMTVAVPIAVIVLLIARDTSIVQSVASRDNLVDRVVSTSFNDGSVNQRATGLRISGEAFLVRPITGWGGENFEVPYQLYQRQLELPFGTPLMDRAHNKPLDLLATTGILGLATYLALWGWIGVLAWRRLRHDMNNRILHAGVAGTLAALFIHELFLFDTAVTALLFALLVAWAAGGDGHSRDHCWTYPVYRH